MIYPFEEILQEAEKLTGQKAKILKDKTAFEINDIILIYEDSEVFCCVESLIEVVQLISNALTSDKKIISVPYFFNISSIELANIYGVEKPEEINLEIKSNFSLVKPSNFNIQGLHRFVYFLNRAPEVYSEDKILDIKPVIESLIKEALDLGGQMERVVPRYALEYEASNMQGTILKDLFHDVIKKIKALKSI